MKNDTVAHMPMIAKSNPVEGWESMPHEKLDALLSAGIEP